VRVQVDPRVVVPGAVDLRRRIRGIVAAAAVASRACTLAMVGLATVSSLQTQAYTSVPMAVAVQVLVAGWAALFVALVLRRDHVPRWALTADVAVACCGMVALAWSARTDSFASVVANPDLEPVTVSVAASVALISASTLRTVASCVALGVAYSVAQLPTLGDTAGVLADLSVAGWQAGTALCCLVFIQRLHQLARAVDTATAEVVTARERLAARRAHDDERMRNFAEQVRRYRAMHDGPLRVLTALAGRGPAAHPDPEVRRQCAVSVNVLRGASPDEPGGRLTELSLALMEAGNQSAALGLRVEYHFASLPDEVPAEVVDALTRASAEALSNVANHAGTGRAQLTALAYDSDHRRGVTVAVVDQGKGFDPRVVRPGYGIRHSIVDRMAEVGGLATVDSHPDQGTRVDLRWPA
jgi:signal transduction histidine kinase